MARTAINLYSVRELDEPLPEILERVADAGYDGVQFSGGLGDADIEAVTEVLDRTGLETTGAHVDIAELEHELEETQALYQETLGCDSAVVPYLSANHFASMRAVEHTAGRLTSLAHRLSDKGWKLHYHNHDHEFAELDDDTLAFDAFAAEASEIGLEVDVGWVQYAGYNPVDLINEYAERIDIVHLKDVAADAPRDECFRELGEGDVDVQACADAARDANASWLVYEHDEPENPVESITHGADLLNSL